MTANLNPLPEDRPAAEMAAWDPSEERDDITWELAELDRHGMLLLGQVGVATLVLALATGVMARFG